MLPGFCPAVCAIINPQQMQWAEQTIMCPDPLGPSRTSTSLCASMAQRFHGILEPASSGSDLDVRNVPIGLRIWDPSLSSPSRRITRQEKDGETDSGLHQESPLLCCLGSQILGGAQRGPTEPDPPPQGLCQAQRTLSCTQGPLYSE